MTGSVSITAWSVESASTHQPWQQRSACPLSLAVTNSLPFVPVTQVPPWMLPMFLEQFTLLKIPLLHKYSVITPVSTTKREKGCYTEEKSNTQVGNQLSLVIQVQLLRIMYKWLFFYLEHVKSKFLPTSTVMDSFLDICCPLLQFLTEKLCIWNWILHVFCRLPLWPALLWPFQWAAISFAARAIYVVLFCLRFSKLQVIDKNGQPAKQKKYLKLGFKV